MGQGDPGVEVETARAIQKSPMYQCLGTTANLEGSSPEASQIKRQKIIGFTYVIIWCNFFKELSKCTVLYKYRRALENILALLQEKLQTL